MAFKLSKSDLSDRENLVAALTMAKTKLEGAIETFNSRMEAEKVLVEEALSIYNDLLDDARQFGESIASMIEEQITKKSDNWQNGEKGQAAEAFRLEWSDNLDLEDTIIEYPDELEASNLEQLDNLENAPEEWEKPE